MVTVGNFGSYHLTQLSKPRQKLVKILDIFQQYLQIKSYSLSCHHSDNQPSGKQTKTFHHNQFIIEKWWLSKLFHIHLAYSCHTWYRVVGLTISYLMSFYSSFINNIQIVCNQYILWFGKYHHIWKIIQTYIDAHKKKFSEKMP